ncbi:MAG: hypothetical protein HY000_28465 [Planctomycetes bacterium]|nr:hypothetical protein [Planctomycetota bacterium]
MTSAADLAELIEDWAKWLAFVELCARRPGAAHEVDAQKYRTLHQGLLEACRSAAAVEGPTRALFREIEELAGPWLSKEAVAGAGQEILIKLVLRCRAVQRQLGGPRSVPLGRFVKPLALGAVALAITFVLLRGAWIGRPGTPSVISQVETAIVRTAYAVKRSSLKQRVYIAAPIVCVVTMWVVYRSTRSG